MSFIKKIFSKSNQSQSHKTNFPWIYLNSIEQFEKVIESEKICLFFKHSTRCIISRTALANFEEKNIKTNQIPCFYLDLLNHREISNAIAKTLQINHQSPQIILVKQGKAIFSATHEQVANFDISSFLKEKSIDIK